MMQHHNTNPSTQFLLQMAMILALFCCCPSAALPSPSGDTRIVLLDDQQPGLAWAYLLGQHGAWVLQPQPPPVFGAAPRNRFPPPISRARKWGAKRAMAEQADDAMEVQKKWSRFEPSIRFV